MGLSQVGACLWKDVCWVRYIVWEMSCGFVSMLPSSSFIQFIITWFMSLKILLCMILGFVFNKNLYLLIAFLQFVAVCLVVIL